jgi:hypothetical protein
MDSSLAEKMLSFPINMSPEAEQVRCALVDRGLKTPLLAFYNSPIY